MDDLELVWAAGFYDGEGCTKVNRQSSQYGTTWTSVHIEINQVDRYVLDRFQRAVGVGAVKGPYKKLAPNHRPQFSYRCGAINEVRYVILALWPYLSPVKQEQALDCFTIYFVAHEHVATRWTKEVTCGHIVA